MKQRTKFFALLAGFLMLLTGNAMAQANGDVNGDGKVNEQDIAAILEIMQQAGGVKEKTKYYWYVGQTNPATMVNINVSDGWTEFTTQKQTPVIVSKQDPDYNEKTWYIAAPYDWGYTLYNATGAASAEAGYNVSDVTLNGVKYKVWTSKALGWQAVGQLIIK